MVDATAWERVGIATPEDFIDRYLRLESRDIINPDMSVKTVQVVAGFRNLDELRNAIFRVSEFRTAEEVGLKLPPRDVKQVMVELSRTQDEVYGMYAAAYKNALKNAAKLKSEGAQLAARRKALGYLVRMSLCSVHEELPTGPETAFGVIAGMSLSDPRMPPAERLRRMALLTKCGRVPTDKSDAAIEAAYRSAREGRIATQEQIEEWQEETAPLGLDAVEQLAAALAKTGDKASDGWTWGSAGRVKNPHSPKIDRVVQEIMSLQDCGHLAVSYTHLDVYKRQAGQSPHQLPHSSERELSGLDRYRRLGHEQGRDRLQPLCRWLYPPGVFDRPAGHRAMGQANHSEVASELRCSSVDCGGEGSAGFGCRGWEDLYRNRNDCLSATDRKLSSSDRDRTKRARLEVVQGLRHSDPGLSSPGHRLQPLARKGRLLCSQDRQLRRADCQVAEVPSR